MWVEEMASKPSDENPVLICKTQGDEQSTSMNNIGKHDFVLGIMTPQMQYMLKEFGNGKVVCIDVTHGTIEYKFPLVTVLSSTSSGRGYQSRG